MIHFRLLKSWGKGRTASRKNHPPTPPYSTQKRSGVSVHVTIYYNSYLARYGSTYHLN